jgi:hypothetical protein
MAELIILPALIIGGIIGLIEMFFVHADEIGMGWFMHGLHAFPFTVAFAFINMNVGFVLHYIPGGFTESLWVDMAIRGAIAVIAMFKISAAAAIAGRVGERFHHTLIIGALIFAAPYLWIFVLAPLGLIPNLP